MLYGTVFVEPKGAVIAPENVFGVAKDAHQSALVSSCTGRIVMDVQDPASGKSLT